MSLMVSSPFATIKTSRVCAAASVEARPITCAPAPIIWPVSGSPFQFAMPPQGAREA
jgi:hypothetical protein